MSFDDSSSPSSSCSGSTETPPFPSPLLPYYSHCFPHDPPRNLHCSICQHLFFDPVISKCGHTFCRKCVENQERIQECPSHPGQRLAAVLGNLAVTDQLKELMVHCRFGTQWSETLQRWIPFKAAAQNNPTSFCTAVVKLAEKESHERSCAFAPIPCPRNTACGLISRQDLGLHLDTCQKIHFCPHKKYGCEFSGSESNIITHVNCCPTPPTVSNLKQNIIVDNHSSANTVIPSCHFEPMKNYFSLMEGKLEEQNKELQRKDGEISELKSIVSKLTSRMDTLEQELEHAGESNARTDLDLIDLRRDFEEVTRDLQRRMMSGGVGGGGSSNFRTRSRLSSSTSIDSIPQLRCLGTFVGHEGGVWSLAECRHRPILFSGSADGSVKVWHTEQSYECLATIEIHRDTILSLEVSSTENRNNPISVFTGSADGFLGMWMGSDMEFDLDFEFEQVAKIPAHPGGQAVCAMKLNPDSQKDSRILATSSYGSVKLWTAKTGYSPHSSSGVNKSLSEVGVLDDERLPNNWVRTMVWLSNDRFVTVCQKTVLVWDVERRRCVEVAVLESGGSVYSLHSIPHSQFLLCGTSVGEIIVLSATSLETVGTLMGHEGSVQCITGGSGDFATQYIVSGGFDNLIKVWDYRVGLGGRSEGCVQSVKKHEGEISALLTSSTRLYSASTDSSLKMWSFGF